MLTNPEEQLLETACIRVQTLEQLSIEMSYALETKILIKMSLVRYNVGNIRNMIATNNSKLIWILSCSSSPPSSGALQPWSCPGLVSPLHLPCKCWFQPFSQLASHHLAFSASVLLFLCCYLDCTRTDAFQGHKSLSLQHDHTITQSSFICQITTITFSSKPLYSFFWHKHYS